MTVKTGPIPLENFTLTPRFAPTRTCIWQFTVLFLKKIQNRPMSTICKSIRTASQTLFSKLRYRDQAQLTYNTASIVNCSSVARTNSLKHLLFRNRATVTNLSLSWAFAFHLDNYILTRNFCLFILSVPITLILLPEYFYLSTVTLQKPIPGDWQLTILPGRYSAFSALDKSQLDPDKRTITMT